MKPFKQFIQKYKQNEKGASATEFALMAPILIVLIVGTADFGMYVKKRMMLQNTAYSVADYVVQKQSDVNVQTVATEVYDGDDEELELVSVIECECADGTIMECPIDCGAGESEKRFVVINATATYTPLFPYPRLPETIELGSKVRLRIQ